MVRLIISCMDYRLSQEVMNRVKDENDIIIRNAGANIYELKDRLKGINADEVVFLPHTDCAAMKLVNSAIKDGKDVDKEIDEKLVAQFRGKEFSSLQELEKLNAEIGEKMLKEIFPNAKITTELIDVNKIKIPQKKTRYYLLKPQTRYNDEIIGSYVIQAFDKEDVTADIKIAESLGLKLEKSELG
ncbi:carbonic anhydrase [Acidianus hospitalis]|uniref:Carbonic anhydrase n=1 Tax=Acidianus hospitalis (strain W1) TaxID=933801 RepID=F4B6B9_ACIHW|nr:carbonic anhydrase [Acidianus hospitalis]AEE94539.1 carbonic anhydrase [Acidianus hospitalis W1]